MTSLLVFLQAAANLAMGYMGAALGAGFYANEAEAFATLTEVGVIEPEAEWKAALEESYSHWKENI